MKAALFQNRLSSLCSSVSSELAAKLYVVMHSCQNLKCSDAFLQVDQQHVIIDYKAGKVSCSDDALRSRVDRAMQRLIEAMNPVSVDGQ